MAGQLNGKIAIVTGAGSRGPGIGNGKAAAILFAREGARVLCVDNVTERAAETVGIVRSEGGEAEPFTADVSRAADCEAMVQAAVDRWGGLDILHNNVGVESRFGLFETTDAGRHFTLRQSGNWGSLAAYRDGQPWLDELLRYLEANRDFAVQYVRSRLPGVSIYPPEATYLAWLDCTNASEAARDPFTFLLERARVALNDGALFGPGGAGFVRLNFGCPRPLLAQALDRMREALTGDRAARV